MQDTNKNKLAKVVAKAMNKHADMDIVSLQGIIDDLDRIAEACYSEEVDPIDISDRIDRVIDELEGWKPYVTNNIKSSKKTAAYPFYEMVRDNSSLYIPNDPIGVQSAENGTTIEQMKPNLAGIDYETEFALSGLSAKYPNVEIDLDQLYKGIEVEMEHTSNRQVAAKIAVDHLAEISNYYDLLSDMDDKAKQMGTFNKEISENE